MYKQHYYLHILTQYNWAHKFWVEERIISGVNMFSIKDKVAIDKKTGIILGRGNAF